MSYNQIFLNPAVKNMTYQIIYYRHQTKLDCQLFVSITSVSMPKKLSVKAAAAANLFVVRSLLHCMYVISNGQK